MSDIDLEDRIRTTLHVVAEATLVDSEPTALRTPWARWIVAAACLALVVGAAGLALRTSDEGDPPVTATSSPPTVEVSPRYYDPDTAAPVFAAAGSPEEVVDAYLRSRFPDFPAPGVEVTTPRISGQRAVARWTTEDASGVIAEGTVVLRTVGARWAVATATTAGVDVSDVSFDGTRLTGTVRSTNENLLAVDILDPSGMPLGSGAGRERDPGSYSFGTAGEGHGSVEIDVSAGGGPVVVLVRLVGGTILSVAEFRLDPPATALTRLAAGAADDPPWELVATDEPTGHWVTLRAPSMAGAFRLQVDEPVTTPYIQIGPCCEVEDHVLIAGALHRDATGLQIILSDGVAIAAEAVNDPGRGVSYAVVAVPRSSIPDDATARVEIRIGEQFVDSGLRLDLLPIGG